MTQDTILPADVWWWLQVAGIVLGAIISAAVFTYGVAVVVVKFFPTRYEYHQLKTTVDSLEKKVEELVKAKGQVSPELEEQTMKVLRKLKEMVNASKRQ